MVKYLYLADYYNSKSEQKKITDWNWKFWSFGPWAVESVDFISEAVQNGYILAQSMPGVKRDDSPNESNDYLLFHSDEKLTDTELEKLGRAVLPDVRTRMALVARIGKFGFKTNPLLNFVYTNTESMAGVKKGDLLDFENLSWSEQTEVTIKPIKTKKLKKAKEIMARIKAEQPAEYHPPTGGYDEIYYAGMNALDAEDLVGEDEDGLIGVACVKDIAFND